MYVLAMVVNAVGNSPTTGSVLTLPIPAGRLTISSAPDTEIQATPADVHCAGATPLQIALAPALPPRFPF